MKYDELYHYGVAHRSGRYPWGSGDHPYQHAADFLGRVELLKRENMSEKEIADYFGLTIAQLRTQKSLARAERRADQVTQAERLCEKYTVNGRPNISEVARQMGINESSVRSLLNEGSKARMNQAKNTAEFLKKQIEEKGMIYVGNGVETELGISKEMMKNALYVLELEGYPTYQGRIEQATNPGKFTTLNVLCPPGTEHKEIYNYENINTVTDYVSKDKGETFQKGFVYPESLDSKRVGIRYAEDGGRDKDGVIELRPGVDDISLGKSRYAQVRILVDGKRYIKGMAVYSDDLPDGVDVLVNTNKHKDVAKMDVLKKITDDPDNPFGALIKENGGQSYYIGADGKKHLSVINKTREEGEWNEWSKTLSSQFLSKQPLELIDKQLKLSIADKNAEFDEICKLENPVVKRKMLAAFAEDCDANAVDLSATGLPRQCHKVILPVTSMKDNEVYAPSFHDGEKIALVRFPHAGPFEMPILTVNNKNKEGQKLFGNALDAVGINMTNADRLSGADFDGDSVLCIPTAGNGRNLGVHVKNKSPLKGLEGFDTKEAYPDMPGIKHMTKANKQKEMGVVSNLIADMTLRGASEEELAMAVRHSMVVIDAEKHKLNYKQSEKDNHIAELKAKYQGHIEDDGKYHEGASTLITKAKSEIRVDKTKGSPRINQKGKSWYDPSLPEGEKIYYKDPETYTDPKTGKQVHRKQTSTKMAETRDAKILSSGTPQEEAYGEYANNLKSLGNKARKEMVYTPKLEYSPAANKKYSKEVQHLDAQYREAQKNAPKEVKAQILAKSYTDAKIKANPDMSKADIKKNKQRDLTKARNQVGAKRVQISISDREWEAIQAGAISDSKLEKIFKFVDNDTLRVRSSPPATRKMSDAKVSKMKSMHNSGYTLTEIGDIMGLSSSAVSKYVRGEI